MCFAEELFDETHESSRNPRIWYYAHTRSFARKGYFSEMSGNAEGQVSVDVRETFTVRDEPFYLPVGNEVALFEAAYAAKLPAMLKGPTGCGKTRFVEHMAWRLGRPLITVACHEDLSATDLVGRFLLGGDDTVWHAGPLPLGVRLGA